MKKLLLLAVIIIAFGSCEKALDSLASDSPTDNFIKYTILKGHQSASPDPYKQVETTR